MPVQKATPTRLRHARATWITLPSATIRAIQSPDTLAILAYLLDQPSDWIIRRDDIRQRFGIGRDRYDRAMRELRSLGLAWREERRDGKGRIIDRQLFVSASLPQPDPAQESEPDPEGENTQVQVLHNCGKPTDTENPPGGKTDHLHSTELLHIDKSSSLDTRARGEVDLLGDEITDPDNPMPLPEGWQPSDETIDRLIRLGVSFTAAEANYYAEDFRDYWIRGKGQGKRRKQAGWQETFFNRIKRIHQDKLAGVHHGRQSAKRTANEILDADFQRTHGLG